MKNVLCETQRRHTHKRRGTYAQPTQTNHSTMGKEGLKAYLLAKNDEMGIVVSDKVQNLRRLEAQRNELNSKGMEYTN